jgi:hypothetical protein
VLAQREYYAIPRVEMQHPSSRASLRKIDAEQKGSSLLRGDKSMEIRMRSRSWPERDASPGRGGRGGPDEGAG